MEELGNARQDCARVIWLHRDREVHGGKEEQIHNRSVGGEGEWGVR